MWTGENGAFQNADVTASIYDVSEHAFGSLGITRGHFACLFSFIEVRMPNIVIDYGISLSNIELSVTAFPCGRAYF